MASTAIHHVEICVADLQTETRRLQQNYGFILTGKRSTQFCDQHVLQVGAEFFLLTQRKAHLNKERCETSDEDWTVLCCQDRQEHSIDSVFNVALLVKDVNLVTERARNIGTRIIKKPRFVGDDDSTGKVMYSIIKSCCGDVYHTLINKNSYNGWFLPGFEYIGSSFNPTATTIWDRYANKSYIDHVTYACRTGESSEILEWYEKVFSMKRFIFNKHDDVDEGLLLDSPVWMRLKAMEYWLCSEIALGTTNTKDEQKAGVNGTSIGTGETRTPQFILVVAESAFEDRSSAHLEEYIRDHQGPGIQHIAFYTSNIFGTIAELTSRGVQFRRPPDLYYQQLDRLSDIRACGYTVESLKTHGILIDTEADVEDSLCSDENGHYKTRHLMQIFTNGVFHPNTFFLEVIQRCGARGFGAGNISALARCIEEQHKQKQESKLKG